MKYTLIALNTFCFVLSKCPVLNLFKYKSENLIESNNITDNIINNRIDNITDNRTDNLTNNITDNRRDNIINNITDNLSDNIINNITENLSDFIDGKATFYFRINDNINGCPDVQTFNDGNSYGPCGIKYNSNSKYWCAIKNSKDYCGKSLTVYYKENHINLTVMDECPSCDNKIDMGLEALIELTGSKENACAINQQLPDIKWKLLL